MSKKAAIYVRVSSERQAGDDRVSIDVQLADCEALCEKRGYEIVGRYVDKTKYRNRKGKLVQPSAQRKDRPAYREMLRAAEAGEFDVIVAWKEDRLYRGMYAAMPFSEILDERGNDLDVKLVKESFDRKMLGIKAALGKIEIDNIRERMMMGRRARLERGEVPGGDQVRYGYRKVNKHLEIDEAEAATVRQIFNWYISGENNLQIRRKLNAMEIPPRKGKRWSKASIQNILTYECYATGKITVTLDDEGFDIPCPPILSMATWRKSQEVRKRNRFLPRNIKEDYLCVGLVYCACGWKCRTVARRSNSSKGYHTISGCYRCQRYYTDPESMPPACAPSTGSKKVDDYVWNFVKRICSNPAVLREAINRKLAALEAEQGDLETEAQRMQERIDELTMERQWVITRARKGAITEEDMSLQLGAMQLQEMAFRKELEERQAAIAARQQAAALSDWANQYLSEINDGIQGLEIDVVELSPEDQKALAVELEAWKYADRYPDDELEQLRWAILEEKRRVVRTLVSQVIVTKLPDRGRKITPILALDMPLDDSLDYGHQSPDYVEEVGERRMSYG